jgi:hypothetical protein
VDPLTYGDVNMGIEEFYKVLGLKGTVKILEYLNKHGKAKYIDLSTTYHLSPITYHLPLTTYHEKYLKRGEDKTS